jgi:hypothetical protein
MFDSHLLLHYLATVHPVSSFLSMPDLPVEDSMADRSAISATPTPLFPPLPRIVQGIAESTHFLSTEVHMPRLRRRRFPFDYYALLARSP